MSNLKLGVEVISAHDLIAKDGQGSSNAYVELHFDNQRFRTTTKEKDLNPVWHETFYFTIVDPNNLSNLTLDAHVYCYNKETQSKSLLGKVHLTGTSFVPYSDALDWPYPLEKHKMFSRVKGELTLKVFITDDPSINPSNTFRAMDPTFSVPPVDQNTDQEDQREYMEYQPPRKERLRSQRRTFLHLPKQSDSQPQQQQQQQQQEQEQPPPQQFFTTAKAEAQPPQPRQFFATAAKAEAPTPKVVQMSGGGPSQPVDYSIKETSPVLGGGKVVGGRVVGGWYRRPSTSTFDLVEKMHFLYVRVVKARELPHMDLTGSLDPYVEVRVGNYRGKTRHYDKNSNPEWNEVFAFARDQVQSHFVEVYLKDKDILIDDFVGLVRFDVAEIPTRVPPDSPLAPQWYRLEDKKGDKLLKGELMLAIWTGTQADEAFCEARHSDTIKPDAHSFSYVHTRSKVYHSPRLWYLRVNVIEAQDLILTDKTRPPDVYVKAQLGFQTQRTKPVQAMTGLPFWNEDLMFVAAEPFEEHLLLSIENRIGPGKEETLARVMIPLPSVRKRPDDKNFPGQWYPLQRPSSDGIEEVKKEKFASRLHLRVTLDGGYHVFDESTYYSSDLRPSLRQLWKSSVGVLELGILDANGIQPMKSRDGRGTADTFCVAKYAQKWVRTRTIIDSLNPKFNEQYTWEVYDPSTVLSVGVFDNGHVMGGKDTKIGKVRIRISNLESGRIYTLYYPLLILDRSGVKKMGQLHLAIRFSCTSMVNLMNLYSKPLLPKMHYSKPLSIMQTNTLRAHAINIVSNRLSRAEPPLRREVVEYMSDVDAHFWSMRRSKANFYRVVGIFQGLIAVTKWFGEICAWKNPITTVLVHLLFLMLVCFPELILPTVFLYMFMIGLWNYRFKPKHPPHMDIRLSCADSVTGDDLDEEFDMFPTSKGPDIVRMRYDRLRSVGSRIQGVMGDVAGQGERFQALLSWRDPRATSIFLLFCICAAVVLYSLPFQLLAIICGFYVMRHPKFRSKQPTVQLNFFRRLPAKSDCML